jgi:hypothetical protein
MYVYAHERYMHAFDTRAFENEAYVYVYVGM